MNKAKSVSSKFYPRKTPTFFFELVSLGKDLVLIYVRDNCSGKVLTDVLEAWERALRPRVACPRPLQMAVML